MPVAGYASAIESAQARSPLKCATFLIVLKGDYSNVYIKIASGTIDLLQKKYVLSLRVCSSLGQTLNYWVDWHLLKLSQPARL